MQQAQLCKTPQAQVSCHGYWLAPSPTARHSPAGAYQATRLPGTFPLGSWTVRPGWQPQIAPPAARAARTAPHCPCLRVPLHARLRRLPVAGAGASGSLAAAHRPRMLQHLPGACPVPALAEQHQEAAPPAAQTRRQRPPAARAPHASAAARPPPPAAPRSRPAACCAPSCRPQGQPRRRLLLSWTAPAAAPRSAGPAGMGRGEGVRQSETRSVMQQLRVLAMQTGAGALSSPGAAAI